jgi:hypothetical protein
MTQTLVARTGDGDTGYIPRYRIHIAKILLASDMLRHLTECHTVRPGGHMPMTQARVERLPLGCVRPAAPGDIATEPRDTGCIL